MITQLCFPSCIMHVRISSGAQPHFLPRCNSGDHYYSSKALLVHYGHGLGEACTASPRAAGKGVAALGKPSVRFGQCRMRTDRAAADCTASSSTCAPVCLKKIIKNN